MEIKIINKEKALTNTDYILKALKKKKKFNEIDTNDNIIEIVVKDVSASFTICPGLWKIHVVLEIMGKETACSLIHSNEDWYMSGIIVHNNISIDSKEYKKALTNFQLIFETIIKKHANEIINIIARKCNEKQEA